MMIRVRFVLRGRTWTWGSNGTEHPGLIQSASRAFGPIGGPLSSLFIQHIVRPSGPQNP